MPVYTDIADEIYSSSKGSVPSGVKSYSARSGPITLTRVQISRSGLERPAGRYSTLEIPSLAVVDDKDEKYVSAVAGELRGMLPAIGPVLVVGVGNRQVTADALGPRAAGGVLVTRGLSQNGESADLGLREVACISPGASGTTGIPLMQLLGGIVRAVKPSVILCIDSLCTSDPGRLGRTVQISDTGLCPARPQSSKCITRGMLGVPVVAVGIPTMMEADEAIGRPGLIITPRELDSVIKKGSNLLSLAINKALQTRLSIAELCYLTN